MSMAQKVVEARNAAKIDPVLNFREMLAHWELFTLLTRKELKIKYKGSALGFMWSLLNPLLFMMVYAVVFSSIFNTSSIPGIKSYVVYLLSGLIPWNVLAASVGAAPTLLLSNSNIIKKLYFPSELIPLANVAANVINFLLSQIVLVIIVIALGVYPGVSLIVFPLATLCLGLFVGGIVLLIASLNVYFRDIEHFVQILVMMWFFLTPIVYARSQVHRHLLQLWFKINPMTWIIGMFQAIWAENTWPHLDWIYGSVGLSTVVFLLGLYVFWKLKLHFAEEL